MFQYALGRRLSLDHGITLELDISAYKLDPLRSYRLNNFQLAKHSIRDNIDFAFLPSWLGRVKNRLFRSDICYFEPHFHYDENVLSFKNGFLAGYWQSEKYFSSIRRHILEDFTIKNPLRPALVSMAGRITNCEAVSVHIRRGDYVNNPSACAFHGVVDLEWYSAAIRYIEKNVCDPQFFFFSDDIVWVRENFPKREDFHFIDAAPDGFEYEDMHLMSCCKHQIIANSSFSWWAAWLNDNDSKIVIAPKVWFRNKDTNTKDILPESWLQF